MLIALLLAGCWLDDWLAGRRLSAGGVVLPPGVVVLPVVCAVAGMAGRELARLLRGAGTEASTFLTAGLAVIGVLLVGLAPPARDPFTGGVLISTAVGLAVAGSLTYYGRARRVKGLIGSMGGALLSLGLVGLLLGFLPALNREHSAWVLLWVLVVTKSSDIGAYAAGHAVGRHKLIAWLSPGKTWEGAVGGAVLAAVVGGVLAMLVPMSVREGVPRWAFGAVVGACLAVIGQGSDLIVSALKRDAGLKDAGRSLPGFGGVLDVVDSLLLAAPAAFWALRWAAGGGASGA